MPDQTEADILAADDRPFEATHKQDRGTAPRDRKARVRGDVGVVNGMSEMHVENAGKEQRFTVRYLAV